MKSTKKQIKKRKNINQGICKKCNGKGYLKENGIVHTCWECLKNGKFG